MKIKLVLAVAAMLSPFMAMCAEAVVEDANAIQSNVAAVESPAPAKQGDAIDNFGIGIGFSFESADSKYGFVRNPDAVFKQRIGVSYDTKGYGSVYGLVINTIDLTSYNEPASGTCCCSGYTNNRRYKSSEQDFRLGYDYVVDTNVTPVVIGGYFEYGRYPRAFYDVYTVNGKVVSRDGSILDRIVNIHVEAINFLDRDGVHHLYAGTNINIDTTCDGAHGDVHTGYAYDFTDKFTAGTKFTAYWRDHNCSGTGTSGFRLPNFEIRPYAEYAVNKWLTAEAYVAGTIAWENSTRRAWYDADSTSAEHFYGGVGLCSRF